MSRESTADKLYDEMYGLHDNINGPCRCGRTHVTAPTPDTTEATLRCRCTADTAQPDICARCGHREHGASGCRAALQQPAVQPESDREYVRRFARALHRDVQPEGGPE